MKTDPIETLFSNLNGAFDLEEPDTGHAQRFFEKLEHHNNQGTAHKNSKRLFSKPLLVIAASLILCFGLFFFLRQTTEVHDLANVSPELSQAQDFFITAINSELKKIKALKTPDHEALIADALKQLELLENNYERLRIDLGESGNDKRVIYAMINNFQGRINILENVLNTIEELKALQPSEHEQTTL